MKPHEPVVVILLDAFRWDYLTPKDTPYMWDIRQRGLSIRQLTPSFGFCEISEYATGVRPDTSQKFTQLSFGRTEVSPFLWAAARLSDLAEQACSRYHGRGSGRLRNWIAGDLLRHLCIDPEVVNLRYRVPLPLLPLLTMPEASRYTDRDAMGTQTLFDVLRDAGRGIDDDGFVSYAKVTGSDDSRAAELISRLDRPASFSTDLFLIYLGECDGSGHTYGPEAPQTRRAAARQSARVEEIISAFTTWAPRTRFVVVGDHGMLPVQRYFDAGCHIQRAARGGGLRHYRDYLLFLDSTMVRIWFKSAPAADILSTTIASPPFRSTGTLLTTELAKRRHVPGPGDAYGHLIWMADPGTMVFPDYFNREPPKGMHGYDTRLDDQKGMAILFGEGIAPGVVEEAELVDLCPTICNLLGIPNPDRCQGHPLL